MGDEGGPVWITGLKSKEPVVVGVLSRSDCIPREGATIVTKVEKFIPWLRNATGQKLMGIFQDLAGRNHSVDITGIWGIGGWRSPSNRFHVPLQIR